MESNPSLSNGTSPYLEHLEEARRTLTNVPEGYTHEEWAGIMAAVKCLEWDEPVKEPDKPVIEPMVARDHIIGTVYFIGPRAGPVKIGFTTDLPRRLKRLQSGSPVKLEVLASATEQEMVQERIYHFQFASQRLHGEWFEMTLELQELIERLNTL